MNRLMNYGSLSTTGLIILAGIGIAYAVKKLRERKQKDGEND